MENEIDVIFYHDNRGEFAVFGPFENSIAAIDFAHLIIAASVNSEAHCYVRHAGSPVKRKFYLRGGEVCETLEG